MNVIPLGDHVVVRVVEPAGMPSGIVLPDAVRLGPCEGKVLSVGDGRLLADGSRSTPQVHEGDRILFARGVGTQIERDVVLLGEQDILATLA